MTVECDRLALGIFPRAARGVSWVAAAGLVLASAANGASVALPPAVTLAHCSVNQQVLDDPASCALTSFDSASASLTASPLLLTAQAQSPLALGIHGAAATATMTYSFAVSGGSPGDVVPILLAASLITSGSDPSLGIGFATLRVDTSLAGGTAALVAVCTAGCGSAATAFSGVLAFSARSGDTGNQVVLQVQASVVGNGAAPESASASIDPYLFVDPSFPNASQYQIVVSPGVANVPLPEPTAALLVAAGAAATLRRRSRKS